MGLPLGPTLANTFLVRTCGSLPEFCIGRHNNISLAIENEKQNRMFILDVQIIREDKTFTTSVYHKPTVSGVYTHFDSFLPSNYKFCTVCTLVYRFSEYGQVGPNYTY